MTEILPEYDDISGAEKLSYQNSWRGDNEQQIEGADCFAPFVSLNPLENIVLLKLSEQQWTEMLSALYIGAEFAYPEKYLQIVTNFLAGIHCPPILAEQECKDFPPYASFVQYSPVSPFVSPDTIPEGYLTQPFLVNGQNGNDIDGYEVGDVIVPLGAITLDIDWLDTIDGQLPTVNIVVQGTGTVLIKFLATGLGGVACITLDNPPNILDIITGVVTGSDNIIDLNQDLVSLPPETVKEYIYEVTISTAGIHTIYIVFLPIFDDSATPVRFGGGIRSIQLCDFVSEGDMGIQNLRFTGCDLEQQNQDGSWSLVDGWENWLDCVPSGGGGSGAAAIKVKTRRSAFTPSQNFTATSFTNLADGVANFNYVPTYSKMLVIADNLALSNSNAGNTTEARITVGGNAGQDATEVTVLGTSGREVQVSDWWSGLTPGNTYSIRLQTKVSANTGTLNAQSSINWTVIEFDDVSALFVEDIRIVSNELQKKIGGVWITVADSLAAILSSIQTIANNALSAANSAIATNVAQAASITAIQATNTTQNTRLNNLESNVDDLQLSVAQHNLDIAALQTLTESMSAGGIWDWYHDMLASNCGYALGSAGAGWTSGQGWISDSNGLQILYGGELLYQNQITHIQCEVIYTSSPTGTSAWKVNGSDRSSFRYAGVGQISRGWIRMPNRANQQLTVEFEGSGAFKLIKLRYLGRGEDVPFD